MDQAKIKQELAALAAEGLPEPEPVEETPPEAEAAEEKAEDAKPKKKKAKAEPRINGLIETEYAARGTHVDVQVNPDQVIRAAEILDAEGMTLEAVTGADWLKEKQMEVIYDYSFTGGPLFRVVVRTRIDRAQPDIPTVSGVFPGANWHERETFDFFGINFTGHPQLEYLLLPEDADFHPLLKDYKP